MPGLKMPLSGMVENTPENLRRWVADGLVPLRDGVAIARKRS